MVLIVVVIGPLVGLRLGPGSLCTLLIRMVSASATSRSYEQGVWGRGAARAFLSAL
jgi:hypothetical protein